MIRNPALLKLAGFLGAAAPLTVLFAAIATDLGWVSFAFGFGVLLMRAGWWLALAGTVIGLIVAGMNLKRLRAAWAWAAVAVLAPAGTLGGYLWMQARADALAPVHETATDWERPLGFTDTILERRGADAHPVVADPTVSEAVAASRPAWAAFAGRRVAELNAEACPEARTVPRLASTAEVVAALEAEGVRVVGQSPWRIEGVQESPWFGRARDVAVRMEPEATDIRVVERIGAVDLGQTCDLAASLVRRLSH